MSKIRKDNYAVTSNGVYGKVVRTAGDIVELDTGLEVIEVNKADVTKISAAQYHEAVESQNEEQQEDTSSVNTEVKAKKETKADIAREVFGRMYGTEGVRRKDIIEAMIAEAGLTKAGAGTYYYNMTKKLKQAE